MDLKQPTDHEAPLIAILNVDIDSLSDEELEEHVKKIRELRAVPAKRQAAVKKTAKTVRAQQKLDIDSLL